MRPHVTTLRIACSSVRALARYKLRTGFILLGTLVGVASLTFVITVGAAAEAKLLRTVRQLFGSSSIVVSAGGGFFMGGPRDATRLTVDDIEAVAADVAGIEGWDPLLVDPETPVRRGERNTSVRLMGQSERAALLWNRGATEGRFFDDAEVASSSRVAVLGVTAAGALFPGEDAVGQEVLIGPVSFRVVGLLESFGTDIHGMDRDNEIVIPYTTAMRRVLNVDSLRGAKLQVREAADVEAVTLDVVRILRERHRLAAGQPDDFTVISSVAVRQMVGRVERVLFLYLPLVTAASLLAALAVAASLMLASVNERTREIGLRRAVGARAQDIQLQFLLETATTTLAGGVGGLLVGGLGALLVAQRFNLDARLGLGAVALGLGLSLVSGLVAGVIPARRAALLTPSKALR